MQCRFFSGFFSGSCDRFFLQKGLGWVLIGVMGLTACQRSPQVPKVAESPTTPAAISPAQQVSSQTGDAKPVDPQGLLRSIPTWQKAPNSIPYTAPQNRVQGVKVGRADPFAPTEKLVVKVNQAQPTTPTGANLAQSLPQIPQTPTALEPTTIALSPLSIAPLPVAALPGGTMANPPAMAAPVSAPSSPTALADQMQVTGVLELNHQWRAIVRESQSSSSKTVQAGDVLANGQVKVRRIEQTQNGLLRIVLEQNGIEVIHTVS